MRPLAHSAAALTAICGAPVALAGAALRPSWRGGLLERLGAVPRGAGGAVWVHGASVGEARVAARLLDALDSTGRPTLASTMTVTGRNVLRRMRPELPCVLAPLDHPWCVATALDRVRPSLLVLVETELWPFWIRAARRRAVPVMLVSGRISERSWPRYRRFSFAMGPTLRCLAAIGARSVEDAERFVALGAPRSRVEVTGDLKLEPSQGEAPLPQDLAHALFDTPLFVAGSTHRGEESAALQALAAAERAGFEVALVLAPRHPERAGEVRRLAKEVGRRVRLRSALRGKQLRPGEVLVLDSVGELPAIYGRASAVFVGGTLVDLGGHNVLEPVQAGRMVLFGPNTSNIRGGIDLLLACGAGQRVSDAEELGWGLIAQLSDPEGTRKRGAAGLGMLDRHRGATTRSVELIERVLGEGPGGLP